MILALLMLAAAAAAPDLPCDRYAALNAPAAPIIPAALSSRYPNDVDVNIRAKVSAAGVASAIRTNAPAPLAGVVKNWLAQATYDSARTSCKAVAGNLDTTETFVPAARGLLPGYTWNGIDFSNFSYTEGPGVCDKVTLVDNAGLAPKKFSDNPDNTASVFEVFGGTIAGTPVALVRLTCSGTFSNFDAEAQVFAMKDGKPERIGILCCGSKFGGDSASPDNWLFITFGDGILYADAWDSDHKCDPKRDWLATKYTIRNGVLAKIGGDHPHHRAGMPPAC